MLSLLWIDIFSEIRYKFSLISEKSFTTVNKKGYIAHEPFTKQPVQIVEMK